MREKNWNVCSGELPGAGESPTAPSVVALLPALLAHVLL
jgi:hypothetical protein